MSTSLQTKAINIEAAGYALIPMGSNGNPQPYAKGQKYPASMVSLNADRFGVRLDGVILLDYDGNKRADVIDIFELWGELFPGIEITDEDVYGEAIQWREVEGEVDGSFHWLFRLPEGFDVSTIRQCINDAWPGLDVKTGNQLIYIKADKTLPGDTFPPLSTLPEAPTALLERMKPTAPARTEFAPVALTSETTKYGAAALAGALEALANAPHGHRNETLNRETMKVTQLVAGGEIAANDAAELKRAALASGMGHTEVVATMKSGMTKGMKEPRKAPARRQEVSAMVVRPVANDECEQEQPRKTRFPLVSGYAGFDALHRFLVKGLLPTNSTCSIYGPSGSFKSFVAVSLGCHVATGKPWDGRKVEMGAVLYIVGEGGVGVPRRIRAWADEYNNGHDVPNLNGIDMPVFMADPVQVAELELAAHQVKEETGLPVHLIVVDTIARCFGAGDENRAADMGGFIAGCDQIKVRTGATVLMVHHTGKNEDNGARGSSALRAALDVELFVKREGGDSQAVTLTCTKMKDGEEPARRAYDLKNRVITYDDDGDEVTSLVVRDAGRDPVEPDELEGVGNLSGNHIALYQEVRDACEVDGKALWGSIIKRMKKAGTWDSKKGTRWRDKLVDDGLIIWDAEKNIVSMPVRPE